MFLCLFLQKTHESITSAILFLAPSSVSWVILIQFDGFLYFGGNAFFALAALVMLAAQNTIMSKSLSVMLFISMSLNLFGYVRWYLYLSPDPYYNLFIFWHITAIIILSWETIWNILTWCGEFSRSLRCSFARLRG